MPPAARITDMHVCPMQTPGLPPIPHVGGPVIGPREDRGLNMRLFLGRGRLPKSQMPQQGSIEVLRLVNIGQVASTFNNFHPTMWNDALNRHVRLR